MKKALLLLLAAFYSVVSSAQVEMILPYSDSTIDIGNETHITDKYGNVFLLSTTNAFWAGHMGAPVDATSYYGITVVMIDSNNVVKWDHRYDTAAVGSYFPTLAKGLLSASQIFLQTGSVVIPYTTDIGIIPCLPNINYPASTYRNGILAIDLNGDVIVNKVFNEDTTCSAYRLLYTTRYANGDYGYVYENGADRQTYISSIDHTFREVGLTIADSLHDINTANSIYDEATGNFIIGATDSLNICDGSGNRVLSFALPHTYPSSFVGALKIASSDSYYVINYVEWEDTVSTDFLAVYSKNGNLISISPSPAFADISIAGGQVWGLVAAQLLDSTIQKPVTIMQMDLFGNVIRRKNIGMPLVVGAAISVNNGNIIVTGSFIGDDFSVYNKNPDRLYFYREAISNIPLAAPPAEQCSGISVFPNPASNSIHIVSNSSDITNGATISIYNTLGQRLGIYSWSAKELDIDISYLSQGVYYIRADNAGNKNICIQKIVKR